MGSGFKKKVGLLKNWLNLIALFCGTWSLHSSFHRTHVFGASDDFTAVLSSLKILPEEDTSGLMPLFDGMKDQNQLTKHNDTCLHFPYFVFHL